jgi:hypothetical protein
VRNATEMTCMLGSLSPEPAPARSEGRLHSEIERPPNWVVQRSVGCVLRARDKRQGSVKEVIHAATQLNVLTDIDRGKLFDREQLLEEMLDELK